MICSAKAPACAGGAGRAKKRNNIHNAIAVNAVLLSCPLHRAISQPTSQPPNQIPGAVPEKLHKTRGLVLRTVKYGETSLIVTIFTELFGLQSYLVNGVRTSGRKGSGRANLFQPGAILDLVVYHNELVNLQRIREFRWGYLYERVLTDITRNAVALYLVELLTRCLRQPEANPDLYHFAEDALLHLDRSPDAVAANFPLFFALQLAGFFGFRISDGYSPRTPFLDLLEGQYVAERPHYPHYLEENLAQVTAELLKVMQPDELAQIRLHHGQRRALLQAYETYYALHLQDFGSLKSWPVLSVILQ
ncbi:MAG TPA: DNA repair protein RecO [Chitinophagaceae bacterium]|nr:DNA repair protein RecO [Chitinophagaceae bacterium]